MKKETYSEISEKKTSKLGYLFLITLFIVLIILGQTVFQDIGRIPHRPKAPCYGISSYVNNLKGITQRPTCAFNEIDRQFKLDTFVTALQPDADTIISFNRNILNNNNLIRSNGTKLNTMLRTYNLSLQETIANEDALLDKPEIKREIVSLRDANVRLKSQVSELTIKKDNLVKTLKPQLQELSIAYSKAQALYKTRVSFYYLKIFLLKLLFVLPFFLVFLRLYMKYKKKGQPLYSNHHFCFLCLDHIILTDCNRIFVRDSSQAVVCTDIQGINEQSASEVCYLLWGRAFCYLYFGWHCLFHSEAHL